jgi:hypothetical protein
MFRHSRPVMFRTKVFGIGLLLTANFAQAATIGYAGDSFNEEVIAKSQATGHTLRHVANFGASELTGLDALWLDGFSIYDPEFNGYDLASPALSSFVQNHHLLLVQSPGFGGNSIVEYPFAADLSIQVSSSEATVRIQKSDTWLWNVSNAQLSNWQDTAQPGYFDAIGDYSGLADNGQNGQWITISKEVGTGVAIYTFQDITRNIGTSKEADALALLKSVMVPEPSTNALLIGSAGILVWRLRRRCQS